MADSQGTDLYRRVMAYDYGDTERNELMQKVWRGTPWMVDVFTGGWSENRDLESDIRHWCVDQFGEEARPIHDTPGNWQRGGATIFGWTWMGFATEEMMQRFMARWPSPEKEVA